MLFIFILLYLALTYSTTTGKYGCHDQVPDVAFVWNNENNLNPQIVVLHKSRLPQGMVNLPPSGWSMQRVVHCHTMMRPLDITQGRSRGSIAKIALLILKLILYWLTISSIIFSFGRTLGFWLLHWPILWWNFLFWQIWCQQWSKLY